MQLQNRTCKPGAIFSAICRRDIAGVSNMFETWCNFAATKIASSSRDKNRLCKGALTNRMWFSVVCTLIDNDTRHHSAWSKCNKFWHTPRYAKPHSICFFENGFYGNQPQSLEVLFDSINCNNSCSFTKQDLIFKQACLVCFCVFLYNKLQFWHLAVDFSAFFEVPMKWKIEVLKNRRIWKAFKSEEEWCFPFCYISSRSRYIQDFCIMPIRYWWRHKVWQYGSQNTM